MTVGVSRERGPFDRRVALTPAVVRRLTAARHSVWVERGAGEPTPANLPVAPTPPRQPNTPVGAV